MKTLRYLCLGLILAGGLLAAPPTANADTKSDLVKVLNIIHDVKPSVPSGNQLDGLFNCVQDPTADLFGCADKVTTAAGGDSQYLDTLQKIIQMYVAIDAGDFWGVVGVAAEWLGDDAPCILADVLLPGVGGDLCGLVKELIATAEALVEAGEALVKAVSETLDAIADFASDVTCDTIDVGCDEPPPPPPAWKVIYAKVYEPTLQPPPGGQALKDIEAPDEEVFKAKKKDLWSHSQAYGGSSDITKAESQWLQVVDANWSADVVQKVNPALGQERMQYEQNLVATIDKIIAADAKGTPLTGTYGTTPSNRIQATCNNAFSKSGTFSKYVHYDRWIDQHQSEATTGKMIKNKDWCNALGPKYQDKYLEELATYVDSLCPELSCATAENYKSCLGAMGAIGQKDQCMIDIGAASYAAAAKIKKFLTDQSQLAKECTINGSTAVSTTGPTEMKAPSAKPANATTQKAAVNVIGQPGQVAAQAPGTSAKSPSASASTTLALIKSGKQMASAVPKVSELSCPRPMHGYWCETKYKEWYGNVPVEFGSMKLTLVQCKVSPHDDYKSMAQDVKNVLAPFKNFNIMAAYNDPLLVPLSSKSQFDLVADKAYFGKPPSKFAQLSAIAVTGLATIDGVNVPTLFFDQSVGIKKSLEQKMPVGLPPKPSPEQGGPTVSPIAGQMQASKGQLNSPALGPAGQLGSMDKATSTKLTGKSSVASGPSTANAAPVPTTALPGAGASSRVAPGSAQQSRAALSTPGAAPQAARSGAPAPASGVSGQPSSTPATAAIALARSAPATQSPANVPAVQTPAGATAPAGAQVAGQRTPQGATVISLTSQKDYSGAVKTFNTSAAGWKALRALQAPPRGCACSALHGRITTLEQQSAALLKEGESLSQNLNAGKLDAAAAAKAAQRLADISKQLDANMAQRKTMASQYEVQLKTSLPGR